MSFYSFQGRVKHEPRWRPEHQFPARLLPRGVRWWLLDDGSLTDRLSALGNFRVERIYQGWQFPLASERSLLQQSTRQLALIREVQLLLDDIPVVFARSVFPFASLTGPLTHLRRLRNSSLGAILFSNPGLERSHFEVTVLGTDCDYLPPGLRQTEPAWGRRSLFRVADRELVVSEVFLRTFQPWTDPRGLRRSQRGRIATRHPFPSQPPTGHGRTDRAQVRRHTGRVSPAMGGK